MASGTGGHGGQPQYGRHQVEVKKDQIVFHLSEEKQKQAAECLKNNGHIKITFKEISVTQLPTTLDNGEKID